VCVCVLTRLFILFRLGYVEHAPSSSPLKFVWSLVDSDQLLAESAPFRELLGQGGGTAPK